MKQLVKLDTERRRGQLVKYAVMKDAPITWSKEEYALDMGQSKLTKLAATKDALIMPRKEESASGMEQLVKLAAMEDAPIKLTRVEFA